jgi:hypothetical protein
MTGMGFASDAVDAAIDIHHADEKQVHAGSTSASMGPAAINPFEELMHAWHMPF